MTSFFTPTDFGDGTYLCCGRVLKKRSLRDHKKSKGHICNELEYICKELEHPPPSQSKTERTSLVSKLKVLSIELLNYKRFDVPMICLYRVAQKLLKDEGEKVKVEKEAEKEAEKEVLDECPICLEEEDKLVSCTVCRNGVCVKCFQTIFNSSCKCPYCRATYSS